MYSDNGHAKHVEHIKHVDVLGLHMPRSLTCQYIGLDKHL